MRGKSCSPQCVLCHQYWCELRVVIFLTIVLELHWLLFWLYFVILHLGRLFGLGLVVSELFCLPQRVFSLTPLSPALVMFGFICAFYNFLFRHWYNFSLVPGITFLHLLILYIPLDISSITLFY